MGAMASPHLSLIRENRRSEAPLCGTVKIAGTKRDRPFSSGKKYLEVKAGSGKPGKTCIPLWTRSIDAREQGQVFWLVSPRAVFPPPEGDSDCSDRPTHGKRLTAAGTAPDSEHGSSPDSLLRLLRRGETPPLPDETKLNTFFYRTTFSTTDFHPPGETPARGNALPSSKARAVRACPDCDEPNRSIITMPLHRRLFTLSYRSVAPTTGSEVFRARLVLPERIPIPAQPRNKHRRTIAARTYRLRTEDFAGENRRSQDETNDAPAENENRPIKRKAASPGEACRFRQGRTRPVHIFTYRTRAARSGRTRHSGYPAAECPRYRPRGSRAYNRRCGTTRSAYRFC